MLTKFDDFVAVEKVVAQGTLHVLCRHAPGDGALHGVYFVGNLTAYTKNETGMIVCVGVNSKAKRARGRKQRDERNARRRWCE